MKFENVGTDEKFEYKDKIDMLLRSTWKWVNDPPDSFGYFVIRDRYGKFCVTPSYKKARSFLENSIKMWN
jgi:hypothetical protein